MAWDKMVPFEHKTGNLLSHPELCKWSRVTYICSSRKFLEWHPVYEFDATLQLIDIDKGYRSAWRMIFQDKRGRQYPMFISRFMETVKERGMAGDRISGRWTFCKQGQNYSICMA